MYVNSFLSFISGSISSTCSRGRLEIESSRIRREKEREIPRARERRGRRKRERKQSKVWRDRNKQNGEKRSKKEE